MDFNAKYLKYIKDTYGQELKGDFLLILTACPEIIV